VNVLVLHQAVPTEAGPEERDVLEQLAAVSRGLTLLGHSVRAFACGLNLEALQRQLSAGATDVVVNLVESLAGTDALLSLPAFVLEALGVPYTGSPAAALLGTSDKPGAKARLRAAGLPTPDWWSLDSSAILDEPQKVIVKAVWEHASFGLTDESVRTLRAGDSPGDFARARSQATGRPHFVESFVPGREFNLSLLARAAEGDPEVLPVAEIDFSGFAEYQPRIVGYRAKWEVGSFEYDATPRVFLANERERGLADQLGELAVACWRLFGLRGYVRVDFRVDETGKPWILEINANPCLAPDAGFAAACQRRGIEESEMLGRILAAAGCTKSAPRGSA
jgi:D-alanine-D-alanine ligase